MELFQDPIALSIIGSDDHVLYGCHCDKLKPITKLYYCRHCTKLRCAKCVTHEVDSFYCPNCLENMPSTEAKIKKNRCANCFDCPSCGHSLSVRATAVSVGGNPLDESPKTNVKKMHYLNCGFCRWTTRDVGLADQATPSGGWAEPELPFTKKMSSLLEYYKQLAQQDKAEKARQKITSRRRSNMLIMDRYGYTLSLGKKSGSISSPNTSILGKTNSASGKEIQAPTIVTTIEQDVEQLPDSFYTEPLCLEEVLTLDQRLKNPALSATKTKELHPKHKHLKVRRSQRCKRCEHNLCKPEFNPSSIKFKIQLVGMQYCPLLQIAKSGNFSQGESTQVVLSLSNPLDSAINVTFMPLNVDDKLNRTQTSDIELPTDTITIAAKDATVEFDGIGSSSMSEQFDDDPKVIHARSSNKVSFYANVIPNKESGKVVAAFTLNYSYKLITAPLIMKVEESLDSEKKKEENIVSLSFPVQVKLGEINATLC
ncbi:dynactin subunit 4-like [Clytia hemisphaerica]|uniref:Dynactin subunit 4 n=1 Tax=Clytia hemisphaerica TaxID=252671 RepID=A0A7M5VA22_9CNID|eukprot:TCONS_00009943-protein